MFNYPNMLDKILNRFRHWLWAEKIDGKLVSYGLLKSEPDDRDFKVGVFGWGEYKPKYQRKLIKTVSIKNQGSKNTCQWNTTTAQKEVDEGIELSVRSLVLYALTQPGMIEGDGLSSLRSGQKCVQSFGIAEQKLLPEGLDDWNIYSDQRFFNSPVKNSASTHKSKSFWSVSSRLDTLKLLDEDRVLATGMLWHSGFNIRGGFSAPWLITANYGYPIMGHAFILVGYDMNYQGRKVYIAQNSFGSDWGDNGLFYIDMDYFDVASYERYAQLDMPVDVAQVINQHQGQFVKSVGNPAIYYITNNTKCLFPDWATFIAYGGGNKKYTIINKEALDKIPEGPGMDIKNSDLWPYIKDLDQSQYLDALLTIINRK